MTETLTRSAGLSERAMQRLFFHVTNGLDLLDGEGMLFAGLKRTLRKASRKQTEDGLFPGRK